MYNIGSHLLSTCVAGLSPQSRRWPAGVAISIRLAVVGRRSACSAFFHMPLNRRGRTSRPRPRQLGGTSLVGLMQGAPGRQRPDPDGQAVTQRPHTAVAHTVLQLQQCCTMLEDARLCLADREIVAGICWNELFVAPSLLFDDYLAIVKAGCIARV